MLQQCRGGLLHIANFSLIKRRRPSRAEALPLHPARGVMPLPLAFYDIAPMVAASLATLGVLLLLKVRGCGEIIPPQRGRETPPTARSIKTDGVPPKRSEHGKHQIQSKRQTVFRGKRKRQSTVGQAGESLQERFRLQELQKLQVKFAKRSKRPTPSAALIFGALRSQ